MLKKDVRIGGTYTCKVSGKLTTVRITAARVKGWDALNTATNRPIRIPTAARLRGEVNPPVGETVTAKASQPRGDMPKRVAQKVAEAPIATGKIDEPHKVAVVVCGPNLRDQSKGQFHVHAKGCEDLKRMSEREPEYTRGWHIEVTTKREVIEDVYSDFIFHNEKEPWDSFISDLHFFPCCDDLPMEVEVDEYSLKDAIDDAVDMLGEYREAVPPSQKRFLARLDRCMQVLTDHIAY